jgi:hypothetical protein
MDTLLLTLLSIATIAAAAAPVAPGPRPQHAAAATEPAVPQYTAACSIYAPADGGTSKLIQSPRLLVNADGTEASFLTGGEFPAVLGMGDPLTFGDQITLRLKRQDDGRVRAAVRFARSKPDEKAKRGGRGDDGVVIRELAVRTVQTVAPGELITLSLEDGSRLEMTLDRVTPRR